MNIDLEIQESESTIKKIKQFEPDPYYVSYFLIHIFF